jgi:hypothetical protein
VLRQVRVSDGAVCDTATYADDLVQLQHHAGVSVLGDMVAVMLVRCTV